jgi:hypothetical protein
LANRSKDVLFRFLLDDKQKSKFAGIRQEASKTQSKFSQLSGGAKALVGGMAALGATKVVQFLSEATRAAIEDNASQVQLKVALQNTTGATNAQVAATEDWIDKTTRATGVTDDELRPALANLVRATGDVDEAQRQMGDAMDIATAKGLPLEAVTTAMAKAANGNVGAMGRLGLKVRDASGAFLAYDEILTEANRTMGGATAEAADSAEGRIRRLNVTIDEAKESIGGALIPILADLATQGTNTMKVMGFLGDKIGDLLPGSEGLGSSIMEWVGPLAVSGQLMEIAAGMVDDLTAAEEANNAVVLVSADRYDDMSGSVEDATAALQDQADELRAQMDPTFNLIDKTNDLADAQTDVGEARDKYGDGSPEHLEALRKEAEAFYNLQAAQLSADGTVSREQYEANLRAMGTKTSHEIDLMMAEFDRLDGLTVDTTINVNLKGRGASTFSDSIKQIGKAKGGPVHAGHAYTVGEDGEETFVPDQDGTIIPHGVGGGGPVTNVYLHMATLVDSGRVVREMLEMARRRGG